MYTTHEPQSASLRDIQATLLLALSQAPDAWQALGARRPFTLQFLLDEQGWSWFLEGNEHGVQLGHGVAPTPTTVWRSSAQTLVHALGGKALEPGTFEVRGDFTAFGEFFKTYARVLRHCVEQSA